MSVAKLKLRCAKINNCKILPVALKVIVIQIRKQPAYSKQAVTVTDVTDGLFCTVYSCTSCTSFFSFSLQHLFYIYLILCARNLTQHRCENQVLRQSKAANVTTLKFTLDS